MTNNSVRIVCLGASVPHPVFTLDQPGNSRPPDDEIPGLRQTPLDPSYTLQSAARQCLLAAAGQTVWLDPQDRGRRGSRTKRAGHDTLPENDRAWSSRADRGNPTRPAGPDAAFPHTLQPVQWPGPGWHANVHRRQRPCTQWLTPAPQDRPVDSGYRIHLA